MAIENILRNAIRHSPEGGVVTLTLGTTDDDHIQLTVRDQGSGVAPEELDKLFLPFYRVDSSRQRGSGGYGLGLSICRRIVQSHGGKIDALNAKPGLEVRITLPASLRVSPPQESL